MAFVDNDPNSPAVAQQGQSAPVTAGGAGMAGVQKAANTPGVNVPAQPSAQLKDYLAANQSQATNFAGQIASDVGGKVQSTAQAIPQAVNTYTGQLYNVPTDAAVNNQVATHPGGLNDAQKATYQQELGASAKVPNAANTFETTQPYQNLTGQIQKNVETANLWNAGNNPASLSTALTPYEPQTATSGDRTLDALLISGTPGAYQQISNAVSPAAGLQGSLDAGTSKANASLRNAITQDQAATASANQAAQTYAQNLTAYLQSAVKSAQDKAKSTNSQVIADLKSGKITPDDASALGLNPDQANALVSAASTANADSAAANLGGLPIALTNYLLQGNPQDISAVNTATAQDYADVAALDSILGSNAPVVPITPDTASQAGKAPLQNYLDYASALKAANLSDQIAKLQLDAEQAAGAGQSANNAWGYDHFGGQSADDFNSYISGLNSRIGSDNSQIQALAAAAPTVPTAATLSEGNGGPNWQHIGEAGGATLANFPIATLAPIANAVAATDPNTMGDIATIAMPFATPVDEIKSIANDIGGWLGI